VPAFYLSGILLLSRYEYTAIETIASNTCRTSIAVAIHLTSTGESMRRNNRCTQKSALASTTSLVFLVTLAWLLFGSVHASAQFGPCIGYIIRVTNMPPAPSGYYPIHVYVNIDTLPSGTGTISTFCMDNGNYPESFSAHGAVFPQSLNGVIVNGSLVPANGQTVKVALRWWGIPSLEPSPKVCADVTIGMSNGGGCPIVIDIVGRQC
jgi:hypothetical protein